MEEKERAVEPVGQYSLRFIEILATAGGFFEYAVQLVSSLCPHHGHSPSDFAKSSRPWVQSEKENVPTHRFGKKKLDRKEHQKNPNSNLASELGRPIHNLLHYRPLGSGTEIKKLWKIRGMFLGGFPAVHDFFPHQDIAARMLSLVLICYFLSWFQKTAVKHTAMELKLLNF